MQLALGVGEVEAGLSGYISTMLEQMKNIDNCDTLGQRLEDKEDINDFTVSTIQSP